MITPATAPHARLAPLLAAVALAIPLLLSSCQLITPPARRQPPPAAPEPVRPAEPTPEQLEIRVLLAEAADALADDRLTSPPEDCAYYRYLRVLHLDPENGAAKIGIADIAERYLTWALQAAQSRRFGEARRHIASARSVDPAHPNIPAVARQVDELQHATAIRYRIPPDGLRAQSAEVAQLLRWIAAEVAELDAMVIITARTDAEGRWIYQQLNDATGTRVRAELQIGTPPSVELLTPAS